MCDHPFLILTRSDVKKIDELERTLDRFLFDRKKSQAEVEDGPHFEIIINDKNEEVRVPIRVEGDTSVEIERKRKYKEELLTMIKANNIGNCPICLEHIDDAVVTICLHLFCRMCMKNIMRNQHCCAICRQYLAKEDVMSLPRENEFSIKDWQAQYKRSAKINQLFQIL
jgi:DNA repair protein RAD5